MLRKIDYNAPVSLSFALLSLLVLGLGWVTDGLTNMMLLLLVGPMVEEFYGSGRLLIMCLVTAAATGLVDMIFFPHTALLGASGIVFMMIILASMVSYQKGRIPLTFFFVAAMYLGQEIYNAVCTTDDISQLTHIIGGALGLIFGLTMRRGRR